MGNGVAINNLVIPSGILTGNVAPYKVYRYVGDLSALDKSNINVRTDWTLFSALTKASSLTGSYNDNQDFINQLIFDGVYHKVIALA